MTNPKNKIPAVVLPPSAVLPAKKLSGVERFLLTLRLIGPVAALVKDVEAIVPGRGKGKIKTDLILATVTAAADVTGDLAGAISAKDLNAIVVGIINATVLTMNTAGIFKPTAVPE